MTIKQLKVILLLSQLALSLLFAWLLIIEGWWIFSVVTLILWLLNARALFRLQSKFERNIQEALQNSVAEDFNFHWPENTKQGLSSRLYQLLNLWSVQLRQFKQARESQSYLLQQILHHLPFTIMLLESDGRLLSLNAGSPPLAGARSEMAAADWPQVFPFLPPFIESTKNEQKLRLRQDGEQQRWLAIKRQISHQGVDRLLIILSNRQQEHEQQEGEALEKILHVLTHEIMNSVSPINSLADTMKLQLEQGKNEAGQFKLNAEQFTDLQSTVQIIQRRSTGLMGFVERYARFARLPKVQKSKISWPDFLEDMRALLAAEVEKQQHQVEIRLIKSQRPLYADRDLIGQVIINLIRNALESMPKPKSGRLISLELDQGDGYHYLRVIDDGPAIEPDLIDKIFLPFFSTKKRGSGIGLSLSRKILMAHGGRLYLQQKENSKAFCLELPY